jgi:hypothetical protein
MAEPSFRVLELVEICDPQLPGRVGKRGAVTQVRDYGDGRFRYGLGAVDDDLEVGGLYDEDSLRPTGQSASPDVFRVPGPFASRELVRVSAGAGIDEISGRVGAIDGSYREDSGELVLGVWFSELRELFTVAARYLESTGERLPPPESGRPASSARVDGRGAVLGHDYYVVLDEVARYL